jgi:hypothetical protein
MSESKEKQQTTTTTNTTNTASTTTTKTFFETGNSIVLKVDNKGTIIGTCLINNVDDESLLLFSEILSRIDIDLTDIIETSDFISDVDKLKILKNLQKIYDEPIVSPREALDPILKNM